MRSSNQVRRPNSLRNGVTAVEMAFAAPILFLLLFASIEFSRANMLVHTASIAATEAARASIIPGATASTCQAVGMQELNAIGISQATVSVEPAAIVDDTTEVTITVSVPLDQNGYIFPKFFIGKTVTKSVTLQREGKTENIGTESPTP